MITMMKKERKKGSSSQNLNNNKAEDMSEGADRCSDVEGDTNVDATAKVNK